MEINKLNFRKYCCRLQAWNPFGNQRGWQDTDNVECSQWKRSNKVCRRSQRSNTRGAWTVWMCGYGNPACHSYILHLLI